MGIVGVATQLGIGFGGEAVDIDLVDLVLDAVFGDGDMNMTASFWIIGFVESDSFYLFAPSWYLVAGVAIIDIARFGHHVPERYVAMLGVGELVVLVFWAREKAGHLGNGAKGTEFFVPG